MALPPVSRPAPGFSRSSGVVATPGPYDQGDPFNDIRAELNATCAQEPIHLPAAIQPHGVLLAADPLRDFRLLAVSANAPSLLPGIPAAALLGCGLEVALGATFRDAVQARLQAGRLRGAAPWQSTLALPAGPVLEVSVHHHAGLILIELETVGGRDAADALAMAQQMQEALADLQAEGTDLPGLARVAAAAVRSLTGYERVLIYRFDQDWHGQAIAESKTEDWEQSLAGLHFPASDIPAQARALYRRSRMRWVPDRDAARVPLLQEADAAPRQIDLSFAKLRAMSPVHMDYHRNMGVNGAMSLSIMQEDRLWGLVVCHHRQPHAPSLGQRAAAAMLTDALSSRVGPAERVDTEQARRLDLARLAALLAKMAEAEEVTEVLTSGTPNIGNLFAATGAAVLHAGAVSRLGDAPPEADIRALAVWLKTAQGNAKLFQTDSLSAAYPAWAGNAAIASGVLAIFLSADRSDLLLWFRPEEPLLVTWGGNPHKPAGGNAALPRQSFERWVETRHGFARPWAEWELEIAESLRHGITDIIVRSLRRIADLHGQLRQAQKMEAVGQLTGGIAHDFNNLLTGITGSLELINSRAEAGRYDELKRYIEAARSSADRATSLIQRLLAFSRRQTLDPKPVDVIRLASTMEELIRRTVGPAIEVATVLPEGLWHTLCDPHQLDNALLNLAINARDAMPGGGRLTIEAANVVLDEAYASRHHDVAAGSYVVVSVTDTGIGMTPDVLAHVFEPFYTTKPTGQGTGLGLSMVYGFAKQSNGYTGIYSEPGHGTTVRLYLPRYLGDKAAAVAATTAAQPPHAAAQGETVLVVDDEPVVRMLVNEVLRDQGYTVIEADTGTAGLRILQSSQHIDLLVTDVGLPGGLNGRQLADAARESRPGLKVLFITGYAENAVVGNGMLATGMQVMTKPFAMETLTARVRAMM